MGQPVVRIGGDYSRFIHRGHLRTDCISAPCWRWRPLLPLPPVSCSPPGRSRPELRQAAQGPSARARSVLLSSPMLPMDTRVPRMVPGATRSCSCCAELVVSSGENLPGMNWASVARWRADQPSPSGRRCAVPGPPMRKKRSSLSSSGVVGVVLDVVLGNGRHGDVVGPAQSCGAKKAFWAPRAAR